MLVARPDARSDTEGRCVVCGYMFTPETHRCPDGFLVPAELAAAFTTAMRNRHYGVEETMDAFAWFRTGWLACKGSSPT